MGRPLDRHLSLPTNCPLDGVEINPNHREPGGEGVAAIVKSEVRDLGLARFVCTAQFLCAPHNSSKVVSIALPGGGALYGLLEPRPNAPPPKKINQFKVRNGGHLRVVLHRTCSVSIGHGVHKGEN